MPIIESIDWTGIATTARVAHLGYTHQALIKKWIKHASVYLNIADTNIAIVGRPSVGKSVLQDHLCGGLADHYYKFPETSNVVETEVLMVQKMAKVIQTIPGQASRERHIGLHKALSSKTLDGIIYVCDWGFTDVRHESIKTHQSADKETIKEIRNHNLMLELTDFKEFCNRVSEVYSVNQRPKWLLIASTKADLYYDDLTSAQNYYHPKGNSEFGQAAKELMEFVGQNNFKIAAEPFCSQLKDFNWNNQLIKSDIGGTENQMHLTRNFIEKIAALSTL